MEAETNLQYAPSAQFDTVFRSYVGYRELCKCTVSILRPLVRSVARSLCTNMQLHFQRPNQLHGVSTDSLRVQANRRAQSENGERGTGERA